MLSSLSSARVHDSLLYNLYESDIVPNSNYGKELPFFKTLFLCSHYCVIVSALKSFYILIFIQIPEADSVIILILQARNS